jgi:hypothetical protein
MAFFTNAGSRFAASITEWLQDTRLLSEAAFRLYSEHKKTGQILFSPPSWPKPQKGDLPLQIFEIKPVPLAQRMDSLLKTLWRSQFIFLETLWEEYLQDLVLELRLKDASIFEPFCEQKFMAGIVRDVLAGELDSTDEIKDEAAARFAAGITRQPWKDQWSQLARLEVGLTQKDEVLPWFKDLDIYFEMRNCIIHRNGHVSSLLHQKTDYFASKHIEEIQIWPQHLDFYRRRFLDCVAHIESKIAAKFTAKAAAPAP